MVNHIPDVDIDFYNANLALEELFYIPASIIKDDKVTKHKSGVYFQDIPVDPTTGIASLDHDVAEALGYFKFDFLNVGVYKNVKDESHLDLLREKEPLWIMLEEKTIVDTLFHLNGNYDIVSAMKPSNIIELAMVVAIKLPCKRYLIGRSFKEVEKEIWIPDPNGEYYLKKSHAVAYATVIVVQMNLMMEELDDA